MRGFSLTGNLNSVFSSRESGLELDVFLNRFFIFVARDPWMTPIHGWLRSPVNPVTRLVEENGAVG